MNEEVYNIALSPQSTLPVLGARYGLMSEGFEMTGYRIQVVLMLMIGLNVFLLAIGTLLRVSTQSHPREVPSEKPLKSEVVERQVARKEPNIVPKVSENSADATEEVTSKEFNRTRWTGAFSPGGNDIFTFLRDMQPENYSGKPDFVLGIPTIAREEGSYLIATLQSLFDNLNGYRNLVLVVFVGEEDDHAVEQIKADIRHNFSAEVADGLIHVISPPKYYYPDWKTELRQSFGDTFQRVKWRSKQNLDQIYLMIYSYFLQPNYYLMLEDDVVASNDYLHRIYLDAEGKANKNFVLVTYCQLGAIGKLFRQELLPSIATYLSLFWSDKPLDWLLLDYMRSRVCTQDKDEKHCLERVKEVEIIHQPSLFQHVGTKSSFPGKIQKMKDKTFKP